MAATLFTNVRGNGFTLYKKGTIDEVHRESLSLNKRAHNKNFRVSLPEGKNDGINIYYYFRGDLIVVAHICNNDRELKEFMESNEIH